MRWRSGWAVLLCMMALALFEGGKGPALAEGLTAQDIAREVMSPACPGRLLIDCTSGEADQLRELIRQKIAQGQTKEQILNFLVEVYGVTILASPPKSGFYWAAWTLPFLALLYGALVLLVVLRIWARRKAQAEAGAGGAGAGEMLSPTAQQDPYWERMEKELKDFEY
ncbi:MAG: cytochrome c-type biogenesis protein CcmH [Candidatus Tectomicrobia bacterium]|uniref:Cytochrome c-type biogenesis protein n=1 Tax=Tectimicrobiota bacterium TaxID=2528274 RepID=A0A932CP92_UNCTE|nr:cytochrome c-type biogenesis protein CcmH [Candidatus Tectomicrobia bacterium]